MKTIFYYILLWSVVLSHSILSAQPLNTKVDAYASPTPESAALGQYTDLPVDLFSGTPSISVPICQISQGDVDLPISMSYHASGIQVRQQASWVGLGWSLHAGGRISRTTRGFADEDADGFFSNNQIHPNNNNGPQIISGQVDGESDIYSFNFNGYSGKFIYDNSGNPILIEKQDLKIAPRTSNGFEGFEITTPDGTRYLFGGYHAEERSKTFSWGQLPGTDSDYEYVSAWLLKEIISFDGRDHIYLEYGEEERYSIWDLAVCEKGYWYCENDPTINENTACYGMYDAIRDKYFNITEVRSRRLTRIYTIREEVLFDADANSRQDIDPFYFVPSQTNLPKALKSIRKRSLDGVYCEQHDFFYSYFVHPPTQSESNGKRLKLDSIGRSACDGSVEIPPYKFEYFGPLNGDGSSFIFDRFSLDADHWGYFNDASNTPMADYMNIPFSTLTCDGKVNQEGGGDLNANPDVNVQNIATLKQIQYPTGGVSVFDYETHRYKDLWIANPRTDLIRGLVNCNENPVQAYCCNSARTAEVSLILTQDQIDNGRFRWVHFLPPSSYCYDANNLSYLRVYQNGSYVGTMSYNVDPSNPNQIIEEDLSFLSTSIVAGDTVRFSITSEFGNASFDLWSEDNEVNTEKYAGGLRIKSITNNPSDGGASLVRTYEYKKDNNSSGVLFFKSDYGYCYEHYGVPGQTLFYPLVYHQFTKPIVLPLNNHEGRYIGYQQVTEHHSSYSVVHEFELPFDQNTLQLTTGTHRGNYDSPFNDAPRFLPAWMGQLKRKDLGNGDEEQMTYEQQEEDVANSYNSARIKSFLTCSSQPPPEFYNYSFKQSMSVIKQKKVLIDGVETQTDYAYNLSDHLQPIEVRTTNSDGKAYKTQNKYPQDYSDAVAQKLVAQNRLLPLETMMLVDNQMVDGSRTTYRFMDASGNQPAGLTSGFGPYPYHFERYEYSWDENGTGSGSWQAEATIERYDPTSRKAAEFRQDGWKKYVLSWDASSLQLLNKTYENHQEQYQYHGQSGLLKQKTAIDGQKVDYFYDQLRRLEKIESRNRNVIDGFKYHYQKGSGSDNYVEHKTNYTVSTGSDLDSVIVRSYLDGLGRHLQQVKKQYAPDGRDVVEAAVVYDGDGRVVKEYVPYPSIHSDGRRVDIPASHKHRAMVYESKPTGRLLSSTPPGWYATTTMYGSNSSGEVVHPMGLTYAANSLTKIAITDPNGNQKETFTDQQGRQILSRVKNESGVVQADTYHYYDDKGRIDKVFPPGSGPSDGELIYTYLYDGADNILKKKIPGQHFQEMRYDQRNLLSFSQDGNLRSDNLWLHQQYDDYGRVVQSGFWSGSNPDGHLTYPFSELLSETIYDDPLPINKGKVYLIKNKILGTANDWLLKYHGYDDYGRNRVNYANNPIYLSLGSEYHIRTFDLADNQLSAYRRHRSALNAETVINERFTYDHQGRLKDVYHKIGSGPDVKIANHQYNHRDFLIQKNLHQSGSQYLQNVDYTYNDQGWLMKINDFCEPDPNAPGGGIDGPGIGFDGLQLLVSFNAAEFKEEGDQLQFAIKTLGQLTLGDGSRQERVREEQITVMGLTGEDPQITYSTELQGSYTDEIDLSMADEKIEWHQMGDFLLRVEAQILSKAEASNIQVFAGILASEVQKSIEKTFPLKPLEEEGKNANLQQLEADQNPLSMTNGTSNDLFAMKLGYDVANSSLGAPAQYNGNIARMDWQVGCSDIQQYGFQYDAMDRLDGANYVAEDFNTGNLVNYNRYNLSSMRYDERGNIERLYRRGKRTSTFYSYIDRLNYTYTDNQLTSLSETGLSAYRNNGFKTTISSGVGSYTYDANGNVVTDGHRGISNIAYNHLNLPTRIDYSNGNWIEWTYDAAGNKVKKQTSAGTIKHYVEGIEYDGSTLEAVYHAEGRAVAENGSYPYEYSLKDHLGNSRVTFSDLNGNGQVTEGEILQQSHYYPFGMQMGGDWSAVQLNKYTYNGKELNEDFGLDWLDFGFRWYDPAVGRWWSVDPLAEKAYDWSPYRYGFDNPISNIDPDGLFEDKKAAKKYAKENNIKTGWFNKNKVKKQKDGSFAIIRLQDMNNGADIVRGTAEVSISDMGKGVGIVEAVTIKPNDVTSTDGGVLSIVYNKRDGTTYEVDRPMIGIPGGAVKGGISILSSGGKGYKYIKSIGGKFKVFQKTVPSKNLGGQARAVYTKVKNAAGKTVRFFKDAFKRDGRHYERANKIPNNSRSRKLD